MHHKGVQNVVLSPAFKPQHYQPVRIRNSFLCQSTVYRPSKLWVFRTAGDPYTFRYRALQPARRPVCLCLAHAHNPSASIYPLTQNPGWRYKPTADASASAAQSINGS